MGYFAPRNTPFISVDEINPLIRSPLILTSVPGHPSKGTLPMPRWTRKNSWSFWFPSKRIARPWGKRSLSKQQPYSESTCFSCVVQYVFLVFLFWFLGSRASKLGCISQLLIPLGYTTSEENKTGHCYWQGGAWFPSQGSVSPPSQGQFPSSRNSCAQRQFLKPLRKERDVCQFSAGWFTRFLKHQKS